MTAYARYQRISRVAPRPGEDPFTIRFADIHRAGRDRCPGEPSEAILDRGEDNESGQDFTSCMLLLVICVASSQSAEKANSDTRVHHLADLGSALMIASVKLSPAALEKNTGFPRRNDRL